jgi:hypothetical protein
MTALHDKPDPFAAPDQAIPAIRNRYFTGKFMNALDFTTEQAYIVKRRWLQNRLFHGWGIACGLKVKHHENPECRPRWVVIEPGIAVDCYGREIIVRHHIRYELPLPPSATADYPAPVMPPFLLCVRYNETTEQPVPALDDSGGCNSALEDNYIREGYTIEVRPLDDPAFSKGCWPLPNIPDTDLADCRHRPPQCGCLEPECVCGSLVPLALIDVNEYSPGSFTIDLSGRHVLGTEQLTHIDSFNWLHGEEIDAEDILVEHAEHPRYHLRVKFDRPLKPAGECSSGTGIDLQTFLVQFRDDRILKFVPTLREESVYYDEECQEAVYAISPRFIYDLREEGREFITVHVTLRCDFIIDCDGKAVDGDHLRAVTPTGNGSQGGHFESWFRLRLLKRKSGHYEQREEA